MKKPTPTEQRVILPNVSWPQFEALLAELGEERTTRLTYDRGKLELMNPLPEHDRCHRLIESLILVAVDELQLMVETIAPILLKAGDRQRAAELDAGYYYQRPDYQQPDYQQPDYQQPAPIHSSNQLDLTQSPPPDLVVEIAINKSTLDKLNIYADLAIPEVWRYVTEPGEAVLKGNLLMYQLQNYQYIPVETSTLFPVLSAHRVLEFIEQSDSLGLTQALKVLRHWFQETL